MSLQRRDSDDAELARTLQEQENFLGEEADLERAMKLSVQEASTREALARTALSSTRTSAPVSEGKSYNPPSTTSMPTSTLTSTPESTSSSTSLPSRSSSSSSSSTSLSQSHSAKNISSVSSSQPTTGDSESLALAKKLQEEEDLKFSRQLEEEHAPRRGRSRRHQVLSDDDLAATSTPTHPPRAPVVHRVFHQPGSGGHVSFVMSSSGGHMLPMQMQMQHGSFPLAAMQQIFGGGMMPFPFQPSVDVDSMSYEELLELEERMGKVKRGATDEDITQLPTSKFRKKAPAPLSSSPPATSSLPTSIGASAFSTSPPKSVGEKSPTEAKAAPPPSEDKSCCICLEDFQDGEDIRRLPCFHIFHQDEIDKWLREHNSCPICKTPIPTSSSSSSSS